MMRVVEYGQLIVNRIRLMMMHDDDDDYIGLDIKYLPTDQQQCGIPKNKST